MSTNIPVGTDWTPAMFQASQPLASFHAVSRTAQEGFFVVYRFAGVERVLTSEDLELVHEPRDAENQPAGARETLSISHPPGVHAHIEYRGEFVRHPGYCDDVTSEHWVTDVIVCDGSSHMSTYRGMMMSRNAQHSFQSENAETTRRAEARKQRIAAVRDWSILISVVALILSGVVAALTYG